MYSYVVGKAGVGEGGRGGDILMMMDIDIMALKQIYVLFCCKTFLRVDINIEKLIVL